MSDYLKRKSLIACTLVIIALLNSCRSGNGRLLDYVPAGSEELAVVNTDMLLKNAGCKIDKGVITLTPDLEMIKAKMSQQNADRLSYITLAAPAIDLENIVFFRHGSTYIQLVRVKAPEIFEQAIKLGAKDISRTDGVTYYTMDDIVIAVDGDLAWIANKSDAISSAIKDAGKKNFTTAYPALAETLENKEYVIRTVNRISENFSAAPYNGVRQEFSELFGICKLNLTDNIADLKIQFTDAGMKPLEFSPYLETAGSDFLRFVDQRSNIVFAAGNPLTKEEFLPMLANIISSEKSLRTLAPVIPYLESIEGTTSISATAIGDASALRANAPGAWDFTATTILSDKDSRSVISLIELSGAKKLADSPSGGEVSQYELPFGDNQTIYAGLFQGTLAASLHPITGDCSNPFTTDFQGARAGFVFTFTPGSNISKLIDFPYGATLTAMLYDNEAELRLRFNGSPRNVLATLINLAATSVRDYPEVPQTEEIEEIVADAVTE